MTALCDLNQLDTPSLLVDLTVLQQNIESMAALAQRTGRALRPMIKTHKSKDIVKMQMQAGMIGVLAAKLDEAEVMAEAGVNDITLAYPIIGETKQSRAAALVHRVSLTLSVDSFEAIAEATKIATLAKRTLPVLIIIDSGLHRLGVIAQDVVPLAQRIREQPTLHLRGVATHAGQVYGADAGRVEAIAAEEAEAVIHAAEILRAAGYPIDVVAIGSTPTVRRGTPQPGITEIRPGNYVFNDGLQVALGSARLEDCAVSVLTTVISRPVPNRAVVDCGSKVLALDRGAHASDILTGFGLVKGHPTWVVERLSEELAVLRLPDEAQIRIGDRLQIIPNHACPVVNLFDEMIGVRHGRVERSFRVDARGGVH